MSSFHIFGSNRFSRRRTNAFRWSVRLPAISDSTNGDYKLEVHSTTIENFFPVITADDNDTLLITYNGVDDFIQFSQGNYDIYDLVDSVRAGLQQFNANFDVTFDEKQYKVNLFVPAGVTFAIRRSVTLVEIASQDWSLRNGEDRFLELLGWNFFDTTQITLFGGTNGYTWVPSNNVRCTGPSYIDLCTTAPIKGSYSETVNKFNAISRMYLSNVPFGSEAVGMTILPEDVSINLQGMPELELFLVDPHGLIIEPNSFTQMIVVTYRISFIPI